MIPQFWLWGLDAIAGDLTARGFQKLDRPARSDSSVYHLGKLHLHGHGLWLKPSTLESTHHESDHHESAHHESAHHESDHHESAHHESAHLEPSTLESDMTLVYRRPTDTWYALPKHAALCIEHFSSGGLAWCDFARPRLVPDTQALRLVRPTVLEHEAWITARHGPNLRQRQLEHVTSRPVRRARNAWCDWLSPVAQRGFVGTDHFGKHPNAIA